MQIIAWLVEEMFTIITLLYDLVKESITSLMQIIAWLVEEWTTSRKMLLEKNLARFL